MSGPITPPLTVTTASGTPSGRPITTIKVSDGDLTISGNVATIDTSGGGAGAPADAEYLLAFDASIPTELTAARKLVVGNNVSMTHGAGANDDVSLNAVTAQEGSTVNGQIQFQGTSKVFDAREVFYYDEPNGGLYVGNDTTNGDATITILADGTGEPTLSLSNPTAAVSLTCDTNQKLKVVGGVNTFVFDASSATGGITWPDGTTQITAASGGGLDTTPNIMQTQLPTSGSNLLQFPLFAQFGIADTTSNSVVQFNTTTAVLFPFFAPKTGDVQSITCKISVTNVDDILVSMYNSDSDNLPNTRIGDEATWDMGTSGEVTLDVSGLTDTWNLTAGSLYYLAMMLETDTTNRPTFYTYDAQDGGGHNTNLPTNDTTTATYQPGNSGLKLSSLSAALPSSVTTSDLTGHRQPFYRVPMIGVVM